ncbi:MAG TPA: serine hydrolase domain-containing protein [Chitinophagaceae bacterium]|nr:serine hydrolase domain-containing protein [Chitinophagaceae bacterium]
MKNLLLVTFMASVCLFTSAQNVKHEKSVRNLGVTLNPAFSKAAKLDSILAKYAPSFLPGTSIAVYSEKEGWWASAQGYADLEKKTRMNNYHLQYLQSVSKMYMAAEILLLKEQGKIKLDSPINKYLPRKYSQNIKDVEKITVRMLLNHTSGIKEYNENPKFLSGVLMHPLQNFSSLDCIKAIGGEDLEFTPGSKYRYRNTNYLLLALIGDALTGDHANYIKKNIFLPLGLRNSYYGNSSIYLKDLTLPESYWDAFNSGIPINITPFQKMTVVCSKGDDGIVCTTLDAVLFLKGLMEGKLLKPESMKEVMNFVKDEKGNDRYGMGMIYFDIDGQPAYGHGGGGVGAGCGLLYIPRVKTYVFFSTNLGVFAEGTLPNKAGEMRDEILRAIMQ